MVRQRYGQKQVLNRGIYFTTDAKDFETMLAQATALRRIGMWEYARVEYRRAFKLVRGVPLQVQYDEWSVDMRHRILSQFEEAVKAYAQECRRHGTSKIDQRIIRKTTQLCRGD
jgi:hypothetical protein